MLGFLDAWLGPAKLGIEGTSDAVSPRQWLIDWTRGGEATASGVSVNEDSALNYSAVWAATCILSESVASLPCVLYRRLPGGGKERAAKHPLYRLLHDAPNAEMDAMAFWSQQLPDLINWGNSYAELVPTERDGVWSAIYPLQARHVKPLRDEYGRLWYRVQDGVGYRYIEAKRMLHVAGRMSRDGITGRGVISVARESIGSGIAAERFGGALFGNGSFPGGFLEFAPNAPVKQLSEEARNRLVASFARKHCGPDKAFKTALLEDGLTWKSGMIPPQDAQFLETRQHNITEIARWYTIPPHVLADLTRATFSNIDSQQLAFLVYSLRPWLVRIEKALLLKLLSPADREEYFAEFLVDALLRADTVSRATASQIEFMNGAINLDEWRARENRNPLPDGQGQRHFVPANLTPIDKTGEAAEPATGTPPKPDAEEPDEPEDIPPADEQQSVQPAVVVPAEVPAVHEPWGFDERRRLTAIDVLVDATQRMLTKEGKAMTRAAKTPGEFLTRLETFYADHLSLVAEAVMPGVAVYLAAVESDDSPAEHAGVIANRHVELSRHSLLKAAEVEPHQLAASVARCVAEWKNRTPILPGH